MHKSKSASLAATLCAALGLSLSSLPVGAQAPAATAPKAPAPAAATPPPAAPPPAAPPAAAPPPAAPPPTAPPPAVAPPPLATAPAETAAPAPASTSWGVPEEPAAVTERAQIFAGYEISLPVADLRDFLSEPSYRGFEMGALWPVYRSLYVGPVFNYHLFYQHKGTTTYLLDSGALTADLYRYAKTWTMGAVARYVFLRPDAIGRPFVGLRMGITFTTMATLVSDLSLYDNPTGFALAPEAGVMLRLAEFVRFVAAVRYDYSTAGTGEWDNISYMAYHLGFAFQNRP
jgi:hypothetical protein